MKNILKITILIFALFGMSACNDVLNTKPSDFVSPEDYYNNEGELNTALSGVYRMLATGPIYGSYQFTLNSISDEFFYVNRTTGPQVLTIDASTAFISQFWTACYQGIERSNLLLENINKPVMNEDKRKIIKGEALFLRAYFHFLLVDHFGEVPLRLSTTKSPLNTSIIRSSISDVYTQIVKDMKEAETLVAPISAYTYNGHVTKTAVQGILAKVFLTMAGSPLNDATKYADARDYALLVINSGLHTLNPSYQQIFINHSKNIYDTKECIWEIEFSGNNTGIVQSAGKLGIVNGILSLSIDYPGFSYGEINTTKRLYDFYTPGDLRRDWSISNVRYSAASGDRVAVEKPVTSSTIYDRQIGKWRRKYEPEPRNQNFNSTNFPVLRYADVLLMYAEAEYYTNGPDGAYDAINQVRRRAFGFDPNTPITSTSVVDKITLSGTGNTGYLSSVGELPVTFSGGNGLDASGIALVGTNGKVSSITLQYGGKGYTSIPTVIIGNAWASNTTYTTGTQVYNGNNLYTITVAGRSTSTAPTNTSGSTTQATTGAVFTYAGARAQGTATIATSVIDLANLGPGDFIKALKEERARELAFEGARAHDLKRWGDYVTNMQSLNTEISANAPTAYKYAAATGANVTSRNVFFPIPANELSINNLAKQNLGW
ncbi:hypothetical protein ADIARSV_2648 [Arcticibacter svalbardensis MN12-7]|uniref:Outer membrane protein n=1 Tax=Arcticibacter svalbardensis MN12-7 TaxID=1150600 RepID=R9GR48_9SPHI|nr:RagB/SusD family nutrient uptake outer membrane protein [Arcticibacter svalbardensis]EOR94153.1 hypothetical protein ADIARSV_2648 [Arcticibacter svalbardensis MN12-7]